MGQQDLANMRAFKNMARQDYEKQTLGQTGSSGGAFDSAGPPTWDRSAWENFKAAYGFYPYGMQNGTQVLPHTFAGAPDWVYELMGLRKPPVQVGS